MDNSPSSFIQLQGPLFERVMAEHIFDDAKTFVDSIPLTDPSTIMRCYEKEKESSHFCLKTFIEKHFSIAQSENSPLLETKPSSMESYIKQSWPILMKPMNAVSSHDTLLSLPHPHIVPGGRFRECFYWDSYFSFLGLNEKDIIECIDNFVYLIETLKFIPNGNRVYFLSRSQPPFFAFMIELVARQASKNKMLTYMQSLEKEHWFWTKEKSFAKTEKKELGHSVYINHPSYKGALNRYYDPINKPRAEAFYKETLLSKEAHGEDFFQQLRAVCESGWDFSSRFLESKKLGSVNALSICPIDLHCLLYFSEQQLFNFYKTVDEKKADFYKQAMSERKLAIQTLFWNEDFFYDYNWKKGTTTGKKSLAALFPLYVKLATAKQAEKVVTTLKASFLQPGGFVTTLEHSGHQWDWPNGWAPLQWITVVGLVNYGYKDIAIEGAKRWLKMVNKMYQENHTLLEKYNVVTASIEVAKGEYKLQEGFGWTNGVTAALKRFVETGKLL
ncbi:trehalase [Candidatus Aerophobetes bacterium]|uniref:Trehalase n=1 Tax=Aerophobetes bacterium TaxID=2030807 RepID=A0A2A4X5H7_UNCAE|nr:MAG: trehalase [Candidatus Aerophobetes bacterium]